MMRDASTSTSSIVSANRSQFTRRRRIPERFLRAAAALLLFSSSTSTTAFQIQRNPTKLQVSQSFDSWSRPESTNDNNDRVGVRKRVKNILQKARSRNRDASIVAEAASMGALSYDSADFVVRNGYSKSLEEVQGQPFYKNGTDVDLVLETATINNAPPTTTTDKETLQVDNLLNSGKIDPLPFTLPALSEAQLEQLKNGERVQEQSRMGRDGSGFVVVDINAPDYVVWEALLDFEKYPQYIGTVREMELFTNTHLKQSYIAETPTKRSLLSPRLMYGKPSITRARFVLSKFKLNIAAVHEYTPHPDGHYMEFSLDKACKNVVLKDAKGIWYTERKGNGSTTRVWLLCELKVSRVLPKFIVDYAAKRAMPRASTWLKPTVESIKSKFE